MMCSAKPDTAQEPAVAHTDSSAGILKVAVLAVGGQGGGVLANWIAELASSGGYAAQMTSVAGVAQRTGATIYYIELAPQSTRRPVFALTPSPGDVDIVIAAELMEAGRAVLRRFCTVDRTTLVASTHRILAVDEKQAPGDGRADGSVVLEEITAAAHRSVCFDMERIAQQAGSMISASLFGALAKSGSLPFPVDLFEQVIRSSGRGVEASLAAFRASLAYASDAAANDASEAQREQAPAPVGPAALVQGWQTLSARVAQLPEAAQPMILAGLRKVVDYQDLEYGAQYLTNLQSFVPAVPTTTDDQLLVVAAKYIANAMCYDDIIRVADLKTRSSRHARLCREQQVEGDKVVHVTEYFHPRAEEFCGTLPAALGDWIERSPRLFRILDKLTNRGRRLRTDRTGGFLLLWLVSRLRPWRRKLLRHRYESAHLATLLQTALAAKRASSDLAAEVLQCQRLVKGYANTHNRSLGKFNKILQALNLDQAPESPPQANRVKQLRQLRVAALQDESGEQLDNLISKLRENVIA